MKTKNKEILFIDTETGGLDPLQNSLLSIGLIAWKDRSIIATKELFLRHEIFKISPNSLLINNIDLIRHVEKSIPALNVIEEIIIFCDTFFEKDIPIVIGGHNTNFDIGFLKALFQEYNVNYSKYFSHRSIDTASILKFLFYSESLDVDCSSSEVAFEYFGIRVNGRHTALGDAEATTQLFNKLIDHIG